MLGFMMFLVDESGFIDRSQLMPGDTKSHPSLPYPALTTTIDSNSEFVVWAEHLFLKGRSHMDSVS